MAKVDVDTLVEYLKGFGVADALIPALIMTASFESGIQTGVEGTNKNETKDFGVFQVNVEEFYNDKTDEPDKTITEFFEKKGREYSKDDLKFFVSKCGDVSLQIITGTITIYYTIMRAIRLTVMGPIVRRISHP